MAHAALRGPEASMIAQKKVKDKKETCVCLLASLSAAVCALAPRCVVRRAIQAQRGGTRIGQRKPCIDLLSGQASIGQAVDKCEL